MTESEAGFTPEAGAADPAGPRPLRLTARDAEDLAVLSSMLQDAICSPSDIGFAPRDGLFALAVNRFCWEAAPVRAAAPEEEEEAGTEDAADLGPVYHRTQCGVRFHGVRRVSTRGFRLTDRGRLLSLLAVTVEAGAGAGHGGEGGAEGGGVTITLTFAGGPRLRLEADAIRASLEDFGTPWPTTRRPRHEIEDAGESD